MAIAIESLGIDLNGENASSPIWQGFLKYGGYAAEGYQTAFEKYQDMLVRGLVEPGKEKEAAVLYARDLLTNLRAFD